MTQPGLFDSPRLERPPRKHVRGVSKAVYGEVLKTAGARRALVMQALLDYRQARWDWPTAAELTQFMADLDLLPRNDPRLVAPRLTELSRDGGLIEALPARPCHVTNTKAHPWRIRQAGSSP